MSLIFSSHPGARERHLQRQYKNPLFTAEQREFDEQRLLGARYMDENERKEFIQAFHDLLEEVAQLPANEGSEKLLDLKSRLEQNYEQCCGLAGEHDSEKLAITRLIDVMMKSIWQSAQGDPEAEMNLKEEELARMTHFQLLQSTLVADLLRPRSPIAPEQLVATLLSETKDDVNAAFQLFDKEQQAIIYSQAKDLLEQKGQKNHDLSKARERLQQIHELLQA